MRLSALSVSGAMIAALTMGMAASAASFTFDLTADKGAANNSGHTSGDTITTSSKLSDSAASVYVGNGIGVAHEPG